MTKIENLEKDKVKLTIAVKPEDWEEAIKAAYKKRQKDIELDGFRKGKVSYEVYVQKKGKAELLPDAVDYILPLALSRAVEEHNLEVMAHPEINVTKISDSELEFTAIVCNRPEVKLGTYKGLKVKKADTKVTEEEIEKELNNILRRYSELVEKDNNTVEQGDIAVIDFEGFKNGTALEGGKAEKYPLEIGSGAFIPGFEDSLIGMKTNEEKEIRLTFPENYHEKSLAGAPVNFKVKVNEIKTRKFPELNDEFVASLNLDDIKTVKDLKEDTKKRIEARKIFEADNKLIDDLLEAASKNAKVEIADEIIDYEVHRMIDEFQQNLAMQGATLEMYFQYTGLDHEKLHKELEPEAKKRVLYRLVIDAIVRDAKIEVTEDELNNELEKLAKNSNKDIEEIKAMIGDLELLKNEIKYKKAIDLLKETRKEV